jgi:hypothetical protein
MRAHACAAETGHRVRANFFVGIVYSRRCPMRTCRNLRAGSRRTWRADPRRWWPLLLLISGVALAGSSVWVDGDGDPLPETPARKTVDGFGGWLLVTPDPDWSRNWYRPPKRRPTLPQTRYVGFGEEVTILAFYTNPATDTDGRIDIRCSVRVIRPGGEVSAQQTDQRCADPDLEGDLQATRISWAVVDYVGEPSDPPGRWVVEVELTDGVRGVSVSLTTDFILTGGSVRRDDTVPHAGRDPASMPRGSHDASARFRPTGA